MDARVYVLAGVGVFFLVALLYLVFSVVRVRGEGRLSAPSPTLGDADEAIHPAPSNESPVIPAEVLELLPDEKVQVDDGTPTDGSASPDPWAVLVEDLDREEKEEAPSPPASAPAPEPTPEVTSPIGSEQEEEPDTQVRDYVMISPVEIWFGRSRVGVRPGTPTFMQFQKCASELFEELKESSRPS